MINPFRKKKKPAEIPAEPPQRSPKAEETAAQAPAAPIPDEAQKDADDSFTAWLQSKVHGGIERRERNDIYEAYSVYGADADGRLCCRYYHRYPEHERAFGLSYTRTLSLVDFNRRLLAELDQGGITLGDYQACADAAIRLTDPERAADTFESITDDAEAALRAFCDSADILKDQRYLHSEGVLSCECAGAVGEDRLMLRFRRPLPHDALYTDTAGVKRDSIGGYDIDNLWIMGVFNRLRERCRSCRILRLTSEWSLNKESLYLFVAEELEGVGGTVLTAIGEAESFRRFGFWSLDFNSK